MNTRHHRSAPIGDTIEGAFHRVVNHAVGRWPHPRPPARRLRTCRLISHRGEHDNRTCFENTLEAFDAASTAGVWGLELDVRWTRDLIPVVIHDADTQRLFAKHLSVGRITLDTLRRRLPLIPTLAEVINRYGGRQHLMIEIKTEPYPRPGLQSRRMQTLLEGLCPGQEFHLIALQPAMFAYFDFLPRRAFVPIAQVRIDRVSRLALKRGWKGLAGHYLWATDGILTRHHRAGQRIGTGFADSRRCLYREVNRGVDWIFSNRAVDMQTICNTAR